MKMLKRFMNCGLKGHNTCEIIHKGASDVAIDRAGFS